MRVLFAVIFLQLAFTSVKAQCLPPAVVESAAPDITPDPRVNIAPGSMPLTYVVAVTTIRPICVVTASFVFQGSRLSKDATLKTGEYVLPATARMSGGFGHMTFLVMSWIPAGTTEFLLTFTNIPSKLGTITPPTYVGLSSADPMFWRTDPDQPVSLVTVERGSIGVFKPIAGSKRKKKRARPK